MSHTSLNYIVELSFKCKYAWEYKHWYKNNVRTLIQNLIVFVRCTSPDKIISSTNSGKTLAKSRLLPAMPNPQFSIDFHIEGDNVPRQSLLIFEIRSASKELLASRRITLHELLGTFKWYVIIYFIARFS